MTLSAGYSPLSLESFDAAELVAKNPPRFTHANKALIHRLACPAGAVHRGTIEVSRWPARELPEMYTPSAGSIEAVPGVFEYAPVDRDASRVEWHLNFAHHDLFCMYGGPLLAQDELQVAEHPALASLREALISGRGATVPLTVERGQPTPVLIKGVERRCRLDSGAIYGHRFARASSEVITRAATPLDPPSISNLIAIEAPPGGNGSYRSLELDFILTTAFSGFFAARMRSEDKATIIHTGFWGCGAYGGDRVLMAMLQIVAAHSAGIDRLVFHTVDREGLAPLEEAQSKLRAIVSAPIAMSALLSKILALKFAWGVSNGT